VLRPTRTVFALGALVTAGAGIALFTLPARTDDSWAWPIAAAPTAAFLGAGYAGASVSLVLAARERAWPHARVIAVLALTLTTLMLLVTLRDLDPFAFDAGGTTGVVAWTWLVVYAILPPLVLVVFLLQERAGGRHEYDAPEARWATRVGLGLIGLVLGAGGAALLLDWQPLVERWPWPLTRLTAGTVGAWLCTYALGLLWFALRDPSWRRMRVGFAGFAVTLLLDLVAAVRLHDELGGGTSTAVYVVGLVVLLGAIAAAGLAEEAARRDSRRAPGAPAAAP
jgi:hypothetical protein